MPRRKVPKGESAERFPVQARVTKELHEKLLSACAATGRSLAAEIEHQLERSFQAMEVLKIINEMAELRAERRQDQRRFEGIERMLNAMPDQVALRLSVFSSRLDRIEDKLRDLEDSR